MSLLHKVDHDADHKVAKRSELRVGKEMESGLTPEGKQMLVDFYADESPSSDATTKVYEITTD